MRGAEVEFLFALLVDRHEGDIPGAGGPGLGQRAGTGISHPLHRHPEPRPERRAEIGTDALGSCLSGDERHIAGARRQPSRHSDAQLAGRRQLREHGRIDRLRHRSRSNGDDERERSGKSDQPTQASFEAHLCIMTDAGCAG